MKRMLWIVFVFLLSLCLFLGCANKYESEKQEKIEAARDADKSPDELSSEENYSGIAGELAVYYEKMSDMTADADCIALVEVLGRRIDMGETGWTVDPMTYTRIRLKTVYKGEENVGDTFEVIEMGGFDEKHLLGDFPQLSEDSEYVLFMLHSEGNHYICGAFQGRFIIREGYAVQQTMDNVRLLDYTPVKLEEFVKLIEG